MLPIINYDTYAMYFVHCTWEKKEQIKNKRKKRRKTRRKRRNENENEIERVAQ